MAAWQGHRDAVQLLINHGADVNAVNKVRVYQFIYLITSRGRAHTHLQVGLAGVGCQQVTNGGKKNWN